MKKLILSILLANVALISANAAVPCKAEHNWYIQGSGSLGWHNSSKLHIVDYKTGTAKQKKGFGGALAIGYIIDSWRFELEGSHRQNAMNKDKGQTNGIKSNTSLMVNIFHDIPLTDLLSLYVGAGVGFSSVNGTTCKTETQKDKSTAVAVRDNKNSSSTKFQKKTGHLDTVAAGQLMAGLTYKISDNVDLFGGYRLFATTKPNFKCAGAKIKQKNIPVTQSVEMGLRFKF